MIHQSGGLSFSPLGEAFNITPEILLKQQSDIANIKNLINNPKLPINPPLPEVDVISNPINEPINGPISNPINEPINRPFSSTSRPVQGVSNFGSVETTEGSESFETLFLKLMKNPNFDELFMKYIKLFKPDLLKETLINGKSNFGNGNGNNNALVNYIIFFLLSCFIYVILTVILKK
jgi:hypothetical protein